MEYFKNLNKIFGSQQNPKIEHGLVGISITAHNISMAHIIEAIPGERTVQSYRCVHTHDRQAQLQAISEYVEEFSLVDYPCNYVLPLDKYVMGMIPTPDPEAEDSQELVREAVKDFVDYPTIEAVIDVFSLPCKRVDDNKDISYAILSPAKVIDEVIGFVQSTGLKLKYIDIQELCLRNLSILHPANKNGTLFLRLHEHGGNIVILQNNDILMTRRLDLATKDLLNANQAAAPTATIIQPGEDVNQSTAATQQPSPLLKTLTLDLHRSIEYCSSIFQQAPVDSIVLTPTEFLPPQFNDELAKELNIAVHTLNFNEFLRFKLPIQQIDQANCLLAFGAALRQTKVAK